MISRFFEADGPQRLLFYYQVPFKKQGDSDEYKMIAEGAQADFVITDGSGGPQELKLMGKAVFFVKTRPGIKINRTVYTDNDVLAGEINENSIQTLNQIAIQFFKPYIQ